MRYLSATDIQIAPEEGFKGFGSLGLEDKTSLVAGFVFADFLSSVIGVITIVGIIWFVFILITGAISFMSAGGDKNAIESAKKKIMNGVIGLVVLALSLIIIKLIGILIGIPDILNFTYLLEAITK